MECVPRATWRARLRNRSGRAAARYRERTVSGIFGTDADLGLLAEYNYDGRDEGRVPATILDDDPFLGARLGLKDIRDTSVLSGAIIDRGTR